MTDRTFRSQSLGRDVTYRVRYPSLRLAGEPIHVVYLLHGNGGTYREWSTSSSLVKLLPESYTLVMPEGHSSYFMNSASIATDRYEDFLTRDLIADAERQLPVGAKIDRAIVGNSMGGFAAIVLAFKHPDLYRFVGALSPPVDYAERRFTPKRLSQSIAIRAIFGPAGSVTQRASDPFVLAKDADPARVPYIFLSAGDQEPLLEPIRTFDALLTKRRIAHAFHVASGGHNWQQWNPESPALALALAGKYARI